MSSAKKISSSLLAFYAINLTIGTLVFFYCPLFSKIFVHAWFILISISIFIFTRYTDQFYKNNYMMIISHSLLGSSALVLLSVLSFELLDKGLFRVEWEEQFLLGASLSLSLTVLLGFIFIRNGTPERLMRFVFILIPLSFLLLIPSGFFPDLTSSCYGIHLNYAVLYIFSALGLLAAFTLYTRHNAHRNKEMFRHVRTAAILKAMAFLIRIPAFSHGGLWIVLSYFPDVISSYKMFRGVILEGIVDPLVKLKETEMRLRREQIFYEETLSGVHDGILSYFLNRKEMSVSGVWEDITGYKVENNRISEDELKTMMSLEDFNRITNAIRQSMEKGIFIREELEIRHRDGHYIWILIRGQEGRHPDDEPCFIAVFSDVSYRKKIEKELISAKEKAEESDRLKTSFLANISHEIRTPLNVILGFSGLLLKDLPDGEYKQEKQTYLQLIRQSSNQLISIISDIIEISRIQNESITLKTQNIPLEDMFRNLQTVYRKLMDDRGKREIRLSWEIPDSVEPHISIDTDIERFHQIWQNLLNNAMKFIEFGQISFGIARVDDDKNITFFVQDTGPGIGRGKDKLIFERFRQGEEGFGRRYGGSGLGLTITRELLRLMDGRIELDRTYIKGARFLFTLPETPHD